MEVMDLGGIAVHRAFLDEAGQREAVEAIRAAARAAPFRQQVTPRGKPLSVQMTAAGSVGWVADRDGYRYAPQQPDGTPWPPIPFAFLRLWRAVTGDARDPDSALFNFYGEGARMGLHQDRDEADLTRPVVSLSLGDQGLFRVGGTGRRDPTRSVWLSSGDVVVMAGPARMLFHGVDRIRFGSSTLLDRGGRLNVTLRVAT